MPKKFETVAFRLEEDEKKQVLIEAKKHDLSISSYFRKLFFDKIKIDNLKPVSPTTVELTTYHIDDYGPDTLQNTTKKALKQ